MLHRIGMILLGCVGFALITFVGLSFIVAVIFTQETIMPWLTKNQDIIAVVFIVSLFPVGLIINGICRYLEKKKESTLLKD